MQFKKVSNAQSYVLRDMYEDYIKDIKKSSVYYVNYTLYCKLCTEYFYYIANAIVEDSEDVKLPDRMGTLSIRKKKMHFYAQQLYSVDFKNSKKYHKKIIFDNSHTDNYKYFFKWDKTSATARNKSKYQFVATRDLKRRLASLIINKHKDYIEL